MINKKNKTYFFVVMSFVCIVFIVGFHILDGRNITLFDPIIEYIKQYHIKDVVNIVAILSGISAILVGVASIRISNLGAVKEYFQQGDNKEYTTARHNLYKKFEEGVSIDPNDADASNTVSFFHFWGLMVKKKYLPFWVFKSASGHGFSSSNAGISSSSNAYSREAAAARVTVPDRPDFSSDLFVPSFFVSSCSDLASASPPYWHPAIAIPIAAASSSTIILFFICHARLSYFYLVHSDSEPRKIPSPCCTLSNTISILSRTAFGLPGRLMISVLFRSTETPLDNIALFVYFMDSARIDHVFCQQRLFDFVSAACVLPRILITDSSQNLSISSENIV